ncbi:hypothetical protein BS47DRAFT_1358662 [Hydnum rufescens UP504]|uniref:Uncharacterized protein n=1 Tax=Hydnum rufescens UP504 TaxID=1448309 RepID=A0A9P6B6T5_9AGAM|nr:hypothetical protein BS47DRAFT_1358662 [Hydnum rufescens UP504]
MPKVLLLQLFWCCLFSFLLIWPLTVEHPPDDDTDEVPPEIHTAQPPQTLPEAQEGKKLPSRDEPAQTQTLKDNQRSLLIIGDTSHRMPHTCRSRHQKSSESALLASPHYENTPNMNMVKGPYEILLHSHPRAQPLNVCTIPEHP